MWWFEGAELHPVHATPRDPLYEYLAAEADDAVWRAAGGAVAERAKPGSSWGTHTVRSCGALGARPSATPECPWTVTRAAAMRSWPIGTAPVKWTFQAAAQEFRDRSSALGDSSDLTRARPNRTVTTKVTSGARLLARGRVIPMRTVG